MENDSHINLPIKGLILLTVLIGKEGKPNSSLKFLKLLFSMS